MNLILEIFANLVADFYNHWKGQKQMSFTTTDISQPQQSIDPVFSLVLLAKKEAQSPSGLDLYCSPMLAAELAKAAQAGSPGIAVSVTKAITVDGVRIWTDWNVEGMSWYATVDRNN